LSFLIVVHVPCSYCCILRPFWASGIQSQSLHHISLKTILILFYYVRLCLPNGRSASEYSAKGMDGFSMFPLRVTCPANPIFVYTISLRHIKFIVVYGFIIWKPIKSIRPCCYNTDYLKYKTPHIVSCIISYLLEGQNFPFETHLFKPLWMLPREYILFIVSYDTQ
jgi:hypothetical protein